MSQPKSTHETLSQSSTTWCWPSDAPIYAHVTNDILLTVTQGWWRQKYGMNSPLRNVIRFVNTLPSAHFPATLLPGTTEPLSPIRSKDGNVMFVDDAHRPFGASRALWS